jgi:hypothetical protein
MAHPRPQSFHGQVAGLRSDPKGQIRPVAAPTEVQVVELRSLVQAVSWKDAEIL